MHLFREFRAMVEDGRRTERDRREARGPRDDRLAFDPAERPDPVDAGELVPAIRYRVLTELLELPQDHPDVQKVRPEMLAYAPAVKLERAQRRDGTWSGVIHASDPRKFQSCLENGLLTLYECGWTREQKAVRNAAKTLRQYLTAKKDLAFFEYSKVVKADERRELYYRWFLRVLALGC